MFLNWHASLDVLHVVMLLYKCISKLICSRLKEAVKIAVADSHAAFVLGRSMVHNILICHDLLRRYNGKTTPGV